jgi:DNA-binding Lrp family transcriptional regulator
LKPDEFDARILEALMVDGRASFREIAKRTGLTTPTVSARIGRMTRSGMIKKFVPILSSESFSRRIFAVISLKVDSSSVDTIARDLSRLPEVEDIYITTGNGMVMKVALDEVAGLQPFLNLGAFARPGVRVASSEIITSIVKEEPAPLSAAALVMDLRCDYCHEEIARARPYTVVGSSARYYFCCKTCRNAYLDKFGSRLAKTKIV